MRSLPPGWTRLRLGEVCHVEYGKGLAAADRNSQGPVPVVGSAGVFGRHESHLVEGPVVVVGRKGSAGSVHLLERPCWPIDTTYFIRVPIVLAPRFLAHQLSEAGLLALDSSTTVPSLRRPDLEATPLVVAPRSEQERIVAAIEEQFSRLDDGARQLARARRLVARMRVSLLATSLGGDWPSKRIEEFASVGSGATPKRGRADYYEGGSIPWVTSGQLVSSFVKEPATYITERALKETSVKLWPKHTLLVAMYGEGRTRGHCSELLFESTTNQACAAIILADDAPLRRDYLKLFFAASYERHRRLASGGVQPNLSLGLVRAMAVPLPPLDEQDRIVETVERRLTILESLTTTIEHALIRSEPLRRSILERAFSGRLVSQDPTDEPASELLARIAAERAATTKPRRRQCA